ncbi:MAG TPA: hypothetical protein VIT92_11925 [Burkholderiaceae bacterium]
MPVKKQVPMTAAIPKTKAQEIIERLTNGTTRANWDQFSLAREKRALEECKKFDAANAYVGLGMIAVLEWNESAVHSNFINAIKLRDDEFTRDNYAISLQMMGRYRLAVEQAKVVSDRYPTKLDSLRRLIDCLHMLGDFPSAVHQLKIFEQRSPGAPHAYADVIRLIDKIITEVSFPIETVIASCETTYDLLLKKKVRIFSYSSLGDGEDKSVFHTLYIDRPADFVRELDMELGDLLFDTVPGFSPGTFWIGVEKLRTSAV